MCKNSHSLISQIFNYNHRSCWLNLGSFPLLYHFDFFSIYFFLLFLVAIQCYVLIVFKMFTLSMEELGWIGRHLYITMVILHAFLVLVFALLYCNLRSLTDSPDLRHTVHSQLSKSLPRYNEDGFELREAWDNTMADGCCGVDGYQDFINLNMSIPSFCQAEVSPSCTKEVSVASNNKTYASGCVEAVMVHIIDKEERDVFGMLYFIAFDVFMLFVSKLIFMGPCIIKKFQSDLKII